MSETDARPVLDWLAGQREAMIALLGELVDIDSGSYDKAGVDAVGAALVRALSVPGLSIETLPLAEHGDAIRVERPGAGGDNRSILLMGHRDTVFPKGTVAQRPFRIEGKRAYGPGVADMKSGLVLNAFVMLAFARFGGLRRPLVALFTGDEEIGSPSSRPIIEAEARRARVAFNAEPGRASGNVVTARRGCIFIEVEVEGRSAHSGVNFADGRSAIEELAAKVLALQGLTDTARGITANVGLISGGTSVNTIAPQASARVDLRYDDPSDRAPILAAVEAIVKDRRVPDTSARYRVYGEFPPLSQTPEAAALFAGYKAAAASLGIGLDGERTGGAADSGFSAAVGTPTLCGVGPVGGRAHSEEEYLELDTLVPRAQALALTILRLE